LTIPLETVFKGTKWFTQLLHRDSDSLREMQGDFPLIVDLLFPQGMRVWRRRFVTRILTPLVMMRTLCLF
jgi:hypothetical protein